MVNDLAGNRVLLGVVIALVVFVVFDLVIAGGGMMGGMAGMMGTPWGAVLALMLLALVLLAVLV